MLFNSWQFAVFLPIVFSLYWALPHRFRWALLLAASYYFYMSWNVKYVALILFTTAVSFAAGLLLERCEGRRARRAVLWASLIAYLGVLFVFKYFDFFSEALADLLNALAIPLHPATLKLLLPVGISFYTFQTLGYVIDVYRGRVRAERHFGIYATFISFFPQLVAGPIERTENLLPQIRAEHRFDYGQAAYGLKLMAWGLFKKMVIADNLAERVDAVYGNVFQYQGFALLLATLFFTVQIYCDFSGYSDIARGSAKLMGIELMENFRSPYLSASVREFWSRWHISLSTWFRDYVYIPLGGNRVGRARHDFNLLLTFLASGLWHGANWTFVAWGGAHGLARIAENRLGGRAGERPSTLRWLARVCLVFAFTAAAWSVFRAQTLAEAAHILGHMLDGAENPVSYVFQGLGSGVLGGGGRLGACLSYLAAFVLLALFDGVSLFSGRNALEVISERGPVLRWGFYLLLGLIILFFSPKGAATEFVYFQF